MDSQLFKALEDLRSPLIEKRETPRLREELYTVEEAAEYLDVSKSYLYHLTSSEKIAHYKPGGKRIYFLKSDLREYVTRNRVSSEDDST